MANSREKLRDLQALPLRLKLMLTQDRIEQWYDHWNGQVYLSFSGGKDSTVLKHIVDGMGLNIPAVFVNTGLEYPEIVRFVHEVKAGKYDCFNSDVTILRPELRFDQVIERYGYPVVSKEVSKYVKEARRAIELGKTDYYALQNLRGERKNRDGSKKTYNCEKWGFMIDAPFKISNQCCDVMKKRPCHKYEKKTGRKAIIATLAEESRLRKDRWYRFGCNAFDGKRPMSHPLSFWTEQDILHYIKVYNVPYAPVYGDIRVKHKVDNDRVFDGQIDLIDHLGCHCEEDTLELTGVDRTGCMFCMFGAHLEKEPNRFQRMKETHPKHYDYCIHTLGLDKVLDYIGVKYE